MKVLGLSPLDKDSTVTLMEDGKVLFAAGEERFTRVKLQNGFPWQALQDALEPHRHHAPRTSTWSAIRSSAGRRRRGCSRRNISNEREFLDEAATGATSELMREARGARAEPRGAGPRAARRRTRRWKRASPRRSPIACSPAKAWSRATSPSAARREWGRAAGDVPSQVARGARVGRSTSWSSATKLKRVEHHLSHAANAYYTSGYDEALIVTLDGYGSGLAGSVSVGRDGAHRARARHRVSRIRSARSTSRSPPASASSRAATKARSSASPPTAIRRCCATCCCARFASGAGQLPDPREQQPLLLAACSRASSRRSTSRRRISTCSKWSRPPTSSHYMTNDRHQAPGAVGRRRRQRQAESAAEGDSRRRRASSSTRTWATAAAAPARRCSSSIGKGTRTPAINDVYSGPSFSDEQIVDALERAPAAVRSLHADRAEDRRAASPPARSSRASTDGWSTARARSATARSSITPRSPR